MIYNINKFSNKKFKFDLTNQDLLRLPNVNPNKVLEKKVELITFDLNNVCMNGTIYTIEEFEKYFEGEEIVNKEVLHTKLGQKLYMVTFDKPHDLDINNIYIYNVAYFKYYEDEEYFLFFNENDDKIADISATGFLSC